MVYNKYANSKESNNGKTNENERSEKLINTNLAFLNVS